MFTAFNGHLDVDFSQFLDFYSQEDGYLLRNVNAKSLKKKYARTNIWSSLPLEVRSARSVDKFKANVIKFVTKLQYYYSFSEVIAIFTIL